jgi:hypothetical protein
LGWAIDAGSAWMICEGLAYLNFCHLVSTKKNWRKTFMQSFLPHGFIRARGKSWEADDLKTEWVDKAKSFDESFHPELVAGFQCR